VLSILFAVVAAAANAVSSVLQRKGAMKTPPERQSGLRVVVAQLHHRAFFGGFGLLIVGFLAQAAALSVGSLAVVQPILAAELPITLLVASRVFRRPLHRREWTAIAGMAGGLAAALAAASPTEGGHNPADLPLAAGCGSACALLLITAVIGWRLQGAPRAALLGITSGGLFGVTATLMATVTARAQSGVGTLFSSWQLYAMALAGLAALVVLQQAYGAGVLNASQPGVTIVDPIIAVALGVTVFHEKLRLGWLLPIEIAALGAIVFGAIEMSRSPLASSEADDDHNSEPSGRSVVAQGN
jgi:drug/metabolite transporter (DMT)-like permease